MSRQCGFLLITMCAAASLAAIARASPPAEPPDTEAAADLGPDEQLDEAAVELLTALTERAEEAPRLLAEFSARVLTEAAASPEVERRLATAPGLRLFPGGARLLDALATDPSPAVRAAVERARTARRSPPAAAGSRSELVESLLTPETQLERVRAAVQFFALGLAPPPR